MFCTLRAVIFLISEAAWIGRISLTDISKVTVFIGYLRLGCMARDKGQIYEASDWFKEALQINQVKTSYGLD